MIPHRFAALLAAVLGVTALSADPAGAAVTCSHNGWANVSLSAAGDLAAMDVSGGAIRVNGVPCGAATVSNTDAIQVTGTYNLSMTLTIDLTGGLFAPGATAESTGVSEIEWYIVNVRMIKLLGTPNADAITFGAGSSGWFAGNLNASESPDDVDINIGHPSPVLTLVGGDGDDSISAGGGQGTGAAYPFDTDLSGGPGNDTIAGGPGDGVIKGGIGDDHLNGAAGWDGLYGGDGNDTLFGGPGGDHLRGLDGNDFIRGGPTNDWLYGGMGADRLYGDNGDDMMEGNADDDLLVGGGGLDRLEGNDGGDDLRGKDGSKDDLHGGPNGTTAGARGDLCARDAGLDTVTTCETIT